MKLYSYLDENGNFDYEYYLRVQTAGNKRKISSQWVDENAISYLSKFILGVIPEPHRGICHGTRRGGEQLWFAKHLPGCDVLGTEISETAEQFPNTIRHDFHEQRPEWVGSFDFVYSNSWDHGYDPPRMFSAWLDQLTVGGVMLIEHTSEHSHITELDPFGAERDEVVHLLKTIDPERFGLRCILEDAPGVMAKGTIHFPADYIVMQRLT